MYISCFHSFQELASTKWSLVYIQVNLFKKGLGVGVPGNQHEKNTYAQGKIKDSKANSGVGQLRSVCLDRDFSLSHKDPLV